MGSYPDTTFSCAARLTSVITLHSEKPWRADDESWKNIFDAGQLLCYIL